MKITILGDGSWGTACALVLAENGHDVKLWCYNHVVADEIRTQRTNRTFLPGFILPANITPLTNLDEALESDIIGEAIPVPYLRTVLEKTKVSNAAQKLWIILSKGIEAPSHKLPGSILVDIYGDLPRLAVLSGPSFAQYVAKKQPTIVSIAATSAEDLTFVKELFETTSFSCATNTDFIGTQLLGALKNIIALGNGLLDGAQFGINTRVFFTLRCLAEIEILLTTLGGKRDTLHEPAGIGDIMLTCFCAQSRNYQCGFALGKNAQNNATYDGRLMTAEGMNTIASIGDIAQEQNIEMPLMCALAKIVTGEKNISYFIGHLANH